MTATTAPQTNDAGFVHFSNRNSSYKGDRYTWARYNAETRELTVNIAQSGLISREYLDELGAFCAEYGIDFDGMRPGDRVTVTLSEPAAEEASEVEAETAEPVEIRAAHKVAAQAAAESADPRLDVYSLRIGRAEKAAFEARAAEEVRLAYSAALRRAMDLYYDRDMAAHGRASAETLLIIRRWTIAKAPEMLPVKEDAAAANAPDEEASAARTAVNTPDVKEDATMPGNDKPVCSVCGHVKSVNPCAVLADGRMAAHCEHSPSVLTPPRCIHCDTPLSGETYAGMDAEAAGDLFAHRVCPDCFRGRRNLS